MSNLLENLARLGIDAADIAAVAVPGGVPQLAVDPGDAGDEAVGIRWCAGSPRSPGRSGGSCGRDTDRPTASPRPRPGRNRHRRPGPGWSTGSCPCRGSILWMRSSAIWKRCRPSKAVPACAATSMERYDLSALRIERVQPVAGREPDVVAVEGDAVDLVGCRETVRIPGRFRPLTCFIVSSSGCRMARY